MREALQRAWLRRGPLALLLLPFSLLLLPLVRLRRRLYRTGVLASQKATVPVVVIGNVVAGGAGKTPVVMAVAERLGRSGLKVAVVSRGHGREGAECLEVTPHSDPARSGDEPLLIASRCRVPVFVARRRAEAVKAALRAHPDTDVVLSDDGLQHYAMARDIEVCVFDDRGLGNGWLLPAGPLREPWPRPVDIVLRTPGAQDLPGFLVRRRLATYAWRADGERVELSSFTGQECDALAGIARPQAFFDMLKAAGIRLRRTWALDDHHDFGSDGPWLHGDAPLLCTEKDAVKLWRKHPPAWAVPLELEIEDGFWSQLESLLRPKLSSPHGPQTA
ncbi:tetraacyldisaccharide 4'-kinase [Ramlibacter henchirensis]|uniref:Tetraacyldisaccharide 4'-kinase n=1 Tax=Ramlibacter henchirensis TaxID=204072 RepID=A0A4Z0BNB7_9BURK|nr:tetraacyldisaccharide 4'-kinase [Ramlibacter henchirensis]TFZ00807.1 tetraacyldisaccharide 4'-kinase [Ramlibacter henchirensis]